MEDLTRHMMKLYGLDPNLLPMALQFPRVPPGAIHPAFGVHNHRMPNSNDHTVTSNSKLEEFRQSYNKFALGLFNMTTTNVIPPTHPLYPKDSSMDALKAENSKLHKENSNLKNELENLKKQNK